MFLEQTKILHAVLCLTLQQLEQSSLKHALVPSASLRH